MEKNNIDNLFKTKAGQGKFAYDESYWAGAEKLLDANVAKGSGMGGGIVAGAAAIIVGASIILSFISVASIPQTLETDQSQSERMLREKSILNEATTFETVQTIETENPAYTDTEKITDKEPSNNISDDLNEELVANRNDQFENSTHAPISDTGDADLPESGKFIAVKADLSKSSESTNVANGNGHGAATARSDFEDNKKASSAFPFQTLASPALSASTQQVLQSSSEYALIEEIESTTMMGDERKTYDPFRPIDNFSFNAGADYSYLFSTRFLEAKNAGYSDFRNENEKAKNTTSFGLNLQVGYKNWLFNTGVYNTVIREEINYPSTIDVTIGIDNGQWNTTENWSYEVDSNWVIDSIYVGHWGMDTSWTVTYDSTYLEQWDSTTVQKEDPELAPNNGIHSLSYIEVPLWFGRSFNRNKFTLDVQGGFSVGFLTNSKGSRYINSSVSGLVSESNEIDQYNKVLFNVMLRTGIRIGLSPSLEASFYPTIRYNLNSVMKSSAIKQRYLGYGFQIGLSYRF